MEKLTGAQEFEMFLKSLPWDIKHLESAGVDVSEERFVLTWIEREMKRWAD